MANKLETDSVTTKGDIVMLLDGRIYYDFRLLQEMEISGVAVVISCVVREGVVTDICVNPKREC